MATAIVTGASMGLGAALARGLLRAGWSVVIDARDGSALAATAERVRAEAGAGAQLVALAGDISDPSHRAELVAAAEALGDLEVVVNNASSLGPTPLPSLTGYPVDGLAEVLKVNVLAPLALIQTAAPALQRAARPRVVNITSDASVEAYPGWGGYGASKAALDHLGAVLAAEEPGWRIWSVDPGDLRTRMQQDAFPGEDISDRPSGRVRLSDLVGAGSPR